MAFRLERIGQAALPLLLIHLSACATGSTSSFTQAPLFFSEAVDGDGNAVDTTSAVAAAAPALASGGDFSGVPTYLTVGGNAVLPVRVGLDAAPIASAALDATPGALSAAVGTPVAAAALGAGAGQITAAVGTPIATAALGAGAGQITAAVGTPIAAAALGAAAGQVAAAVTTPAGAPIATAALGANAGGAQLGVGALGRSAGVGIDLAGAAVTTTLASPTASNTTVVAAPASVSGVTTAVVPQALVTAGSAFAGAAANPLVANTANLLNTTATNLLRSCGSKKCG